MSNLTFRRSRAFWAIVLVSILCLIVIILAVPAAAEPTPTPLLWLNPAAPVTSVGGSVDVDMQLDNVTGVYGGNFELSFDPAILQVTGGLLTSGTCPLPGYVLINSADNVLGTIEYLITQLNPTPPCNGGVVATIAFECIAEGTSAVTYTSSSISDMNGLPIAHGTQNGTVECQQLAIDIIGRVALQGWPDPSGVEVTLYDTGGIVDGPVVVGADGAFALQGNDETETYRVVAEYDRYLDAEAAGITGTAGSLIDLGTTTLRAGDINGDGIIDIFDLTALGGNFNKTSPQPWTPAP